MSNFHAIPQQIGCHSHLSKLNDDIRFFGSHHTRLMVNWFLTHGNNYGIFSFLVSMEKRKFCSGRRTEPHESPDRVYLSHQMPEVHEYMFTGNPQFQEHGQ